MFKPGDVLRATVEATRTPDNMNGPPAPERLRVVTSRKFLFGENEVLGPLGDAHIAKLLRAKKKADRDFTPSAIKERNQAAELARQSDQLRELSEILKPSGKETLVKAAKRLAGLREGRDKEIREALARIDGVGTSCTLEGHARIASKTHQALWKKHRDLCEELGVAPGQDPIKAARELCEDIDRAEHRADADGDRLADARGEIERLKLELKEALRPKVSRSPIGKKVRDTITGDVYVVVSNPDDKGVVEAYDGRRQGFSSGGAQETFKAYMAALDVVEEPEPKARPRPKAWGPLFEDLDPLGVVAAMILPLLAALIGGLWGLGL